MTASWKLREYPQRWLGLARNPGEEAVTMGNLADLQRMGGGDFHIGDCHVWAEIHYLDSPTGYREYLPPNCAKGPRTIPFGNLVLLESSVRSPGRATKPLSGLMVFVFVLLISGLASYCVFEVLQAAAVRINTVAR